MGKNFKDEKASRKYLLGDVTPEEQERIERWLMSDEQAYDLLAAEEDDLVDDFLAGKLKTRELRQFEKHFLAAPERLRKVQFGRALKRYIEINEPSTIPEPKPSPFSQIITDFFRFHPATRYALASLMVLLAVGWFWAFVKVAEMERQLDSATVQLSSVQREREEFKRRLGESRSLSDKLKTQFQALDKAVADWKQSSSPHAMLALTLTPGITRSSNRVPEVKLSSGNRLLQFTLLLLDDNYGSYRVTLLNGDGKELWTRDQLAATAAGQDKAVVFTVPGELLAPGDYSLNLAGASDSQPPEDISRYHFRATEK